MSKKSIGILAYYWPPAGGSGVQRWLRFSNHLSDLGWDVHVFTFKNPKYPIIDNSSCLLYTSPSPRDVEESRMPSSA
mgnify:CR=1 FL=1